MLRTFFIFFIFLSSLVAFETTNLQLLYSNNFKGDAFIYDTVDGKKTTLTFEHYRTFGLGDFYMFVDAMEGEKFDGVASELYSELSPRFSLSKLSSKELSLGVFKEFYLATQLNVGNDYRAYLLGAGVDMQTPGFNFVSLNLYHKSDNIHKEDTFQISSAYASKSLYGFHFEGFIDITGWDVNAQNQLLYNLSRLMQTKERIFVGTEWLYYDYSYKGRDSFTNVLQAMLKYKF